MRTLATIREPVLLCLRRRDPSSPGKETLQLLLSIDEGFPSGWDVSNTGGIADDVPKGVTLRPRRWQPVTPAQKARLFPDGQSAEVESVVLPAALEFLKEVIQSSRANYWERLEPYKGLYFAELDSVPSGLGGRQFLDIRTEIRLRDGVQEESWLFPLPCPLHGPDGVLVVE